MRKGPFGLFMGMKESDVSCNLEQISPCKFRVANVPMPHSAFEFYVLQIAPKSGLSWIKAVGKSVNTSSFGVELRSAYEALENRLSTVYGRCKRLDFLMHDSIWNEPRDWMQSLESRERVLISEWSVETGAQLKDSLSSVSLIASAVDASTGYLAVEYSFQNADEADAEVAALEDDAL